MQCQMRDHVTCHVRHEGLSQVMCVECVINLLGDEAEVEVTLQQLMHFCTSQQLQLHIMLAAKLMAAIVNLMTLKSCPREVLQLATQALSAVLLQLGEQERDEVAGTLLDKCLELQSDAEGRDELISCLLAVSLRAQSQHSLAVKSGKLYKLLLSPLSSEGRHAILASLVQRTSLLDILCTLHHHQAPHLSPRHLSTLLQVIDGVLCELPPNMCHTECEKLINVTLDILVDVKKALRSRDNNVQMCGVQCVFSLLMRHDSKLTACLFSTDVVEFLVETLNTTDYALLQLVFRCMWLLCTSAHAQLYSRGLAGRIIQGLLRALHLVLTQQAAENVTVAGFSLLSTLLLHSKGESADLSQQAHKVVSLIQQGMHAGTVTREPAIRVLADLLLVIPKGVALTWPGIELVIREAASCNVEHSPCSCFVLRLVRGAINATSGESELSVSMQTWGQQIVIGHAESCILKSPVRNECVARLLAVLEQMFAQNSWQEKPQLARDLISHGFLQLAYQLVNDEMLVKRGIPVLAQVVLAIAGPQLGPQITLQQLSDGLRYLPDPWLSPFALPQSPEARDAALALCYCLALTSHTCKETYQALLPGLLALLRSPLATPDRLPMHATKAVLLILALASQSEAPVWPVPLEVQSLLLRWTPAVHHVYTHHVALLRWSIAQSPGAAPLELLTTVITEWFSRGEKPNVAAELLCAHPSGLPCFLEVIQSCCNENVAKAASLTVQLALSEDPALKEQLWLRLPILLQRTVQPGSQGPALLLQLAAQGLPRDSEITPEVIRSMTKVLPDLLTRFTEHDEPWAQLTLTTGLQVAAILLPTAQPEDVAMLTRHEGLMRSVQNSVNHVTNVRQCTAAMHFTLQLISLPSQDESKADRVLCVHGATLTHAVENVLRSPGLTLAALRLLAKLPEPQDQRDSRVILKVEHTMVTKFADTLYRQLHFLTAKSIQVGSEEVAHAAWCCLRSVLQWQVSRSLVLFPYTHTLIWTCIPPSPRAARDCLLFTRDWVSLQGQARQQRVSKLRLLGTTVEHLLQSAEKIAQQGCLELLIDILNASLKLEGELGPRVVNLTRNKLEELQFMH